MRARNPLKQNEIVIRIYYFWSRTARTIFWGHNRVEKEEEKERRKKKGNIRKKKEESRAQRDRFFGVIIGPIQILHTTTTAAPLCVKKS